MSNSAIVSHATVSTKYNIGKVAPSGYLNYTSVPGGIAANSISVSEVNSVALTLTDKQGKRTVLSKEHVDDILLLLEVLSSPQSNDNPVLSTIKKEMDVFRSLKKMGYQHDV
jgi:hypothetical protein